MKQRSLHEIELQLQVVRQADGINFQGETLIAYLPFRRAKPYLDKGSPATEEAWQQHPQDRQTLVQVMADYMAYAIAKAEDHRTLSAHRSIDHYRVWLWLLHDDKLSDFAKAPQHYRNYGAPILLRVCEKYGFSPPMSEAFRFMAQGKPCRPGCESGCIHILTPVLRTRH